MGVGAHEVKFGWRIVIYHIFTCMRASSPRLHNAEPNVNNVNYCPLGFTWSCEDLSSHPSCIRTVGTRNPHVIFAPLFDTLSP